MVQICAKIASQLLKTMPISAYDCPSRFAMSLMSLMFSAPSDVARSSLCFPMSAGSLMSGFFPDSTSTSSSRAISCSNSFLEGTAEGGKRREALEELFHIIILCLNVLMAKLVHQFICFTLRHTDTLQDGTCKRQSKNGAVVWQERAESLHRGKCLLKSLLVSNILCTHN